jgi:DNA-binding response OmpR family regulator
LKEQPKPEAGTVLVVDDDPAAVDILCRLLEFRGFRTLRAMSGRQALEIAPASPPDVIVMDVMMPEMDGLAVCAELAKDERTSGIPLILLTGKDDHQTRVAGMKLGVSEFLTKPVNKTELYNRVQAQIRARQALRSARTTLDTLK